jgi:hypothetical protein
MANLPARAPMGARLLQRGGTGALLDFCYTAPPPLRERLRKSTSSSVRAVLEENAS